jgi:hypothetical protein
MVRRFDVSLAITRLMPTSSALGTSDIGPLRHSAAYCRRGYKRVKYSKSFRMDSDSPSVVAASQQLKIFARRITRRSCVSPRLHVFMAQEKSGAASKSQSVTCRGAPGRQREMGVLLRRSIRSLRFVFVTKLLSSKWGDSCSMMDGMWAAARRYDYAALSEKPAVIGGSFLIRAKATWLAGPATNDWSTATNWIPATVPTIRRSSARRTFC